MNNLQQWLGRLLADTELIALLASLLAIFSILVFFGGMLAPLLVAIAFAYVLDGVVELLERCRIPRLAAVILTGGGAVVLVLFLLLAVLPVLSDQISTLLRQAPEYLQGLRENLQQLQSDYAEWIDSAYLQNLIAAGGEKLQEWGGQLLGFSIASIPGMITLLVYMVLVPVLVFFLLKDEKLIIAWMRQFLPRRRLLLVRVWSEVDHQIGNYIRGKFWETVIVGVATYLAFWWLGHEYALLLGVMTGFSVWIPFIGAVTVTIPVVLLSFFQWGWSDMTLYSLAAYIVIQVLDGNVLVPWLFSEMVDLHPIAIIVAVLVFGSFWGIVGVFIAIPMASLVKSVLAIILERREERAQTEE